ncbi:hypothetical protein Sme01_64850 [Sphaerisporangium melleum]|uniref:Uncharacterized protein n=1 Tax=Sphaerisporangium melleum TaxID=321316 RepID=A0A917RF20_9ACTN|nr:hypothetical protein [Sphaerisporangium melleum]GGL03867.1 hypothetical protein GCM10007964_52460 [Sphaerisporangium melleum]GII74009.1 hypothetical protein Sme01_64850 [Sphaerisporangium melleum]
MAGGGAVRVRDGRAAHGSTEATAGGLLERNARHRVLGKAHRPQGDWWAGQAETPSCGHPGLDLGGGGLFPLVARTVRKARRLVRVRRVPAPPAAERHRRLIGMPAHADRPDSPAL